MSKRRGRQELLYNCFGLPIDQQTKPKEKAPEPKYWQDSRVFKSVGRGLLLATAYLGINALIDEGGALADQHSEAVIQSQDVGGPALSSIIDDHNGAENQAEEFAIIGTVTGIGYIATRLRRRTLDSRYVELAGIGTDADPLPISRSNPS